MAPVFIMPVPVTDESDWNPTVNEYGVQQHVKPGFQRRADFGQHNQRENILTDCNNRPHFPRQNGIKNIEKNAVNNSNNIVSKLAFFIFLFDFLND